MAIYQGPRRNDILSNGFGTIIDSSLNLYLDPANSACYISGSNSTTLLDLSGKVNNGVMTGGPTVTYSVGSGSITIPGTGYALTSLNIDTAPVTICAWAYGTNVTTRGSILTTDNGGFDRGIDVNASRWYLHTGTSAISTGYLLPNTWYNVVVVYGTTAPTLRLYVNSVLIYTGSLLLPTVGSNLSLGSTAGNLYNFTGNITVASAYKRELTQAEITQNFNVQATRFGLNLKPLPALKISLDAGDLASYPGSGSVIKDLSGNGFDGLLSSSLANGVLPVYSGLGGGSLYFNGSGVTSGGTAASYITSSVNLGTVHTIDTWINPQTTAGVIWFSRGGTSGNYFMYLNNNTVVQSDFGAAVGFSYTSTANVWQNYVIVRNGTTIRLYVNGFLRAAQNTAIGSNPFDSLRIGARASSNQFATRGYLSTFKAYDGILDDIQIYNNFQSTRARYGV